MKDQCANRLWHWQVLQATYNRAWQLTRLLQDCVGYTVGLPTARTVYRKLAATSHGGKYCMMFAADSGTASAAYSVASAVMLDELAL